MAVPKECIGVSALEVGSGACEAGQGGGSSEQGAAWQYAVEGRAAVKEIVDFINNLVSL